MIISTRITWKSLNLEVGYHNSKEFSPSYVVAVDEKGEESGIVDNILPFLTSDAVYEIELAVLDSRRDAA